MFIFLFLSLGQLFASANLANEVYKCIDEEARNRANIGSSLHAVAEACAQIDGQGKIKVVEAKLDKKSTTHVIRLSDGEKSYFFAFNTLGTVYCNDESKRVIDANLNSFIVDMKNVLSHTEHSREANTCNDYDIDPDGIKFGFGFKKTTNNTCKRICPKGQVFKGEQVPIIYRNGKESFGLMGLRAGKTEIFLNTYCVSCPKSDSTESRNYTKTNPNTNSCYDSDGCKEGSYYIPSLNAESLISAMPSITDPKKICLPTCDETTTLDEEGMCQPDPKKQCEEFKNVPSRIDNWLSRFLKVSETSKIGSCDMNLVRSKAVTWANDQKKRAMLFLAHKCPEDEYFSLGNRLGINILLDPRFQNCLMKIEDGSYDARIYMLLYENFFSKNASLDVYQ